MRKIDLCVLLAFVVPLLASCQAPKRQSTADIPAAVFNAPAPREADAQLQQALKEKTDGNIGSAVARLETVAQTYPENAVAARALSELGNLAMEQGRADQSIKYFDYLLYMYPQWSGAPLARVDRLRALRLKGEKREVLKEALALWQSAGNSPDVQFPLSMLLTLAYLDDKDQPSAYDWLMYAASKADSPERREAVVRTTLDMVGGMDEPAVRKLMARNPVELIAVVLEYRLAQMETASGQSAKARERLTNLLPRTVDHPLATEIRQALGETPSAVKLPLHPERVGCLIPLSGPHESFGRMVMRGLAMAAEEWNGSHPNQPVNLVLKDTQTQPEVAARALDELAKENGVFAVVGLLSKQSIESLSPVVSKLGMPLLTMTQKDETAPNPYVFHVFLDKEDMVRAEVRHCKEKLGCNKFAALYPAGRYGESLENVFDKVVHEVGGNFVASASYEPNSTDFREPIQKLIQMSQKNDPVPTPNSIPFDALFIPDESQTVALIAPQLPYYNLVGVTLLGTNIWGESPPINEVGGVYVEKAMFATPFHPESKSPVMQAFVEKFKGLYQSTPSYLEAQAYDAMKLFLMARSRLSGSSMQRTALIQNLLQIKGYDGVTGKLSFAPTGELDRTYLLMQVQGGKLVQVSP
ncbi:MAG: penicillin-binding protein activator [Syntrophobacteraceae bacterium]